jgi:radical SAM superfamily enzyme YgiQ (UPF0313 family)
MTRGAVLLVVPPVLCAKTWWANRIANKPHLASLAGYVRDLAEVRILELDMTSGDDSAALLRLLDEQLDDSVGLVGISCWTSLHYLGTLAVAKRVRILAPDIPIVVGGHHPTARPSDFSHEICDWVVRGDGEQVMRSLCTKWPRRPQEMRVIAGRPFDQSNPDHVDWERYGNPGAKDRVLWVGASRGCGFQCRFCVEPQRGAAYSRYTVDDTLEILERLVHSHEPSIIAFSDPLFGAHRPWTEALLAGLARRSLPLMFWAETRADLMTPELLDAFKRCRFMLDFGLDTASTAMIEHMEKSANPERYLSRCAEILEHADAIGLAHGVYLIFNYPGETPETTRETQRFVDSLGNASDAMSGWLSAQTFFILPGTQAFHQMAEHAASHGTEIRHPHWWKETGDHYALATDVLPSAAWIGREDELRAFNQWNQSVNTRWTSRYPANVEHFMNAFYAGPPAPAGSMTASEI